MGSLQKFIKNQLEYRFLFRFGFRYKCCCGSLLDEEQIYEHYKSAQHLVWIEEQRIIRQVCPIRRRPMRDVERWNKQWNEIPLAENFRPSKVRFE